MTMPDREFDEPDFEKEWLSLVARLEADDSPPTLPDDPADLGPVGSADPDDDWSGFDETGDPGDDAATDHPGEDDTDLGEDAWPPGDVLDRGSDFGFATNRQWTPDELSENDEDSFEPPEPPPLGWRDSPPILVLCWIGTVCAPLYALFVVLFWHNAPEFTILLAIVAFIAGVTGLIVSMPDHRDDSDDGAVV